MGYKRNKNTTETGNNKEPHWRGNWNTMSQVKVEAARINETMIQLWRNIGNFQRKNNEKEKGALKEIETLLTLCRQVKKKSGMKKAPEGPKISNIGKEKQQKSIL